MAWFTAPAGTTCVAAYDAVGAASLADSYVNEANPGTNDAAPGVAPTWAVGTGWTFNGTTQYLTTGVVPVNNQTWSIIVRFSSLTQGSSVICGMRLNGAPGYFRIIPRFTDNNVYYGNGNQVAVTSSLTSGVLAVGGTQGYRNGVAEGAAIAAGGGAFSGAVYIGAGNQEGVGAVSFTATAIQALAIYSGTLSGADVATITAQMNALGPGGLGWWNGNGTVVGAAAVAAYDAVGAASLADSYVNEANPGTYTAAPGTAPSWAYGTGWTFTAASSQYLTTGIVPVGDQTWSAIVRFSGFAKTTAYQDPYGARNAVGNRLFHIDFGITTDNTIYYANGTFAAKANTYAGGVAAVAGNKAYRNGADEGVTIGAGAGADITAAITIGCLNNNGSRIRYWNAAIAAIAFYSGTLSAADVATITTAMQELEQTNGVPFVGTWNPLLSGGIWMGS